MKIGKIGKQDLDLDFLSTLYLVIGIQLLTMIVLGLCYIIFILGLAFLVA